MQAGKTINSLMRALKFDGFPSSYVAFDIETSGFSHSNDVIIEWGHVIVRDRKVVDRNSVVLNWYDQAIVSHNYISDKLRSIARQMELNARWWRLTEAVLRDEGINPIEGLTWLYEFLTTIQDSGMMLISHNGWNFDTKMITNAFNRDLAKPFTFKPNQMLDTASIEKASQMIGDLRSLPIVGEDMQTYFKRIFHAKVPGLKWNLDMCVEKYKFKERFGVDTQKLHSAGEDAYVLHLLIEEYRRLSDMSPMSVEAPVRKIAAITDNAPRRRKQRNF